MDIEKKNGGGIHHTFIFVPFGNSFASGVYYNFFNNEEDCGNLRSTLERAAQCFRESHPYVSAAVFLIKTDEGTPILYELFDVNNVPTKSNNSSFRPGFRKGSSFGKL